jgi:ParB family chromosome partitioning protein
LGSNPLSGFFEELDVRRIRPSRRGLRDELGSLDELVASIEEEGLLQPIVVRPVGDGFEVVAGNRRLEACKRLKMKKIPCVVVELDDREAFEASLIENLQHKTLNPIEEAKAFKRYVDEYGWGGVSELARRIGKSHSYVSMRIALLNLPKEVQEALVRRRTTPSVAQELLSLDEEHRATLSKIIVEKKVTRSEVRRIIKQVREGYDAEPITSYYSLEERRQRMIERALMKCIASSKVCMMRFDDALEYVDDNEWLVREMLMQHRAFIHWQIDNLLKLKRKIKRQPPCLIT